MSMLLLQIRCCGCNRVFNPSGLSHHLSQTQHSRCCAVHEASQTPSTTFQTGCSLAPNSNSTGECTSTLLYFSWANCAALWLLHISDAACADESADIGHSANGATANATNLANPTNSVDNSVNVTEPNPTNPDPAKPDATAPDPADPTNADIHKYLTRISTSNPEQGQLTVIQSCSPSPHGQGQSGATMPPLLPDVQLNSDTSGAQRQLVIDQFLYGSPGMPIIDGPQGTSVYQATQHTLRANTWSPFCSQTDWKFAHWAKLSGPSSSALTELLAIPEVGDHVFL